MSKKNSMVVFYFGDEQKSVKVTKKTSPKKLKQRLFDAFNIDSKHSIEGLANDNIYSLRGFLKNFDLRKPYHLILQKSGSKAKDSPNCKHLQQPKPKKTQIHLKSPEKRQKSPFIENTIFIFFGIKIHLLS